MRKKSFLLCLILLISFQVRAQTTLTFCMPDDPLAKISAEVLKEAYFRIGISLNFKIMPANRSLLMSNDGRFDGEVNRIDGASETYKNLIRIPVPINRLEGVVFTKKFSFHVTDWSVLKNYTIGIRRGTLFAERGTKGMDVKTVGRNSQLFLMLNADRIDIVVTSRVEGLERIKKLGLKNIKALEPPLVTLNLYHYLNSKNSYLVPKIQKVLAQMEKEGRIKAIRNSAIKTSLNSDNKE